ncbi:hypothetical protein N8996_04805 [Candidatus Poseidonia alphae]|nr:hypothetical protein [Candidatus Poseidonia alphae]
MTSITSLDDIKDMIIILHKTVETINDKIEVINKKLDENKIILDENTELICKKIDEDISDECKKMGSHIDFIEGIYDKMKYPLNYLCNTINNISNNNQICDDNSK